MRPRTTHPLRGPPSTLSDVIKLGFFHQVRLLVTSGVDLEARDHLGRTPIILCAFLKPEGWCSSLAMTLLEHGARVARRDRSGRNALHFACIYEREALVRVLLGAIDFNLNQADKASNTALHYAVMSGNISITQLLAQTLRRYKISPDKVNNHGRTALDEAYHTGNGGCARIIELEMFGKRPGSAMKDVRFADEVSDMPHQSLSVPSSPKLGKSLSVPSSPLLGKRVLSLRPSSAVAFLTRRDSNSTLNSTDDKRNSSFISRSRSNLSLPVGGYGRKSQNPLYANGYRKDEDIIVCASENDFRNKPDYVFKMVHMPWAPSEVQPHVLRDSTNCPSSAWGETSSTSPSQAFSALTHWRKEFKMLYQVYENQCSPSWRAGRKLLYPAVDHDPSCSGPPDDGEDMKGRRGRRSSVVSGSSGGPNMRRRMSVSRLKRLPSTGRSDSALDTSSESINSLTSSKRRGQDRGEAGQSGPGGGTSRSGPA